MSKKKMIQEIILEVNYLKEDNTMPKNLRNIINTIEDRLNKEDLALEISSIIYDLEETTNSSNMPLFCRDAMWALISKLENVKENLK